MEEKRIIQGNVIHSSIVTKLSWQMPKDDKMDDLANLYKNFGDTTRVKILWALSMNEMCVCDLGVLLKMTKSAVSHQLKLLRLSELVKFRRAGKVVYYSLADDHVKAILQPGLEHVNE